MANYIHRVQYYETDKMGVTHHSNYIRWMEEARIHFFEAIGWSYARMEQMGIVSPVISMECQYKRSTTFADEVEIAARIAEFKGVRLIVEYTMTNRQTGELVLAGKTVNCFTDAKGRPVILKKQFPEFDRVLRGIAEIS